MIFTNRHEAGRMLADQLKKYANSEDVIVLGIPRGGVPVAYEIATALHAPLDIFLSRKLGVPGYEELAFGALAAGDGRFLDEEIVRAAGIPAAEIERITQETRATLDERARLYRGNRPPPKVEGRTVILVDDGIATGASIYAAIRALRGMNPAKLIVAVPVAPRSTCDWLSSVVDALVVLAAPRNFYAVGQFYERFPQISDEEVVNLLTKAKQSPASQPVAQHSAGIDPPDLRQQDARIPIGEIALEGTLTIPENPKGIVIFAHGSGSSRHSPRNRYVAGTLQSKGLATLLFDLLTPEEEALDRRTAQLRFNIDLLAKRLIEVTEWVTHNPATRNLAIGYFGASTGAAAALVAAARLPNLIFAVISRGGRPDLASNALGTVRAPTLLIVGGLDGFVLSLNRQALDQLGCEGKQLVVVQGATHLFEEPGTLEQVAGVAGAWLLHYLSRAQGAKETGAFVPKAV